MSTKKALGDGSGVVTKEVNVVTLADPKFLTLVKHPGNQVAFKVVRSDGGSGAAAEPSSTSAVTDEVDTASSPPRIRRARAVARSALLSIEYPSTMSDDDAKADLALMNITGYRMYRQEDGKLIVMRNDLTELPPNTFRIGLGDSRFATILRSESVTSSVVHTGPVGIALAAINFSSEQFPSNEHVLSYLSRREVVYIDDSITRSDDGTRVLCSEVPDGVEVRSMEIDPGVVVSVVRSDETVAYAEPDLVMVVNDTAYGMWGWGQLDFAAAMADREFSESGREATDKLSEVLRDILFYSSLPVSVRKELIVRAVGQYASYMISLLEALPEKLSIINRSSKENSMSIPQKPDEPANTATAAEPPPVAAITRADVQQIVTEALAALALTQQHVAPVTRTDDATKIEQTEQTDTNTGASETADTVMVAVQRSVTDMAAVLAGIDTRLAAMENATVVRSDNRDSRNTPAPVRNDTFAGIFGAGLQHTNR